MIGGKHSDGTLLLLRLGPLLLASTSEDARERVISFVARILVNHLVDAIERQLTWPWR